MQTDLVPESPSLVPKLNVLYRLWLPVLLVICALAFWLCVLVSREAIEGITHQSHKALTDDTIARGEAKSMSGLPASAQIGIDVETIATVHFSVSDNEKFHAVFLFTILDHAVFQELNENSGAIPYDDDNDGNRRSYEQLVRTWGLEEWRRLPDGKLTFGFSELSKGSRQLKYWYNPITGEIVLFVLTAK